MFPAELRSASSKAGEAHRYRVSIKAVGSKRVNGGDNGAASLGHAKACMSLSRGSRLNDLEELQNSGPSEPNNLKEESYRDLLSRKLFERKIAHDERDARLSLETHYLMKAQNYKVEIALSVKGIKTISMALLDIGVGPNLIKGELVMAAWAQLMKAKDASRRRFASHTPAEGTVVISVNLQMEQLQKILDFSCATSGNKHHFREEFYQQ